MHPPITFGSPWKNSAHFTLQILQQNCHRLGPINAATTAGTSWINCQEIIKQTLKSSHIE